MPGSHTDHEQISSGQTPEPADNRKKSKQKRSKRRKFGIALLTLMAIFLIVGGYAAIQTKRTLDVVHSQSTPPAVIGAESFGLEGSPVQVDTGPARAAIQTREAQRAGNQTAEPTATPATPTPTETEEIDQVGPIVEARQYRHLPTTAGSETDVSVGGSFIQQSPATPGTNEPATDTAVNSGGINILLMGVDARPGEAIDIGVRPDSLAVLHLDQRAGTCRILAIPRDSRVETPGYGLSKVNHSLAVGGIPYQMLVIEDYLGITLDHYALIDFTGLSLVVEKLDGIWVNNPTAFTTGSHEFAQGRINLDGERALAFARYRGGPEGDFGRVKNQQLILRALIDRASVRNAAVMIPETLDLLEDHFRTDLGVRQMIRMANDFVGKCTGDSIDTATIPGAIATMFDDMLKLNLSFVVSQPEDVARYVHWLMSGELPDTASANSDPERKDVATDLYAMVLRQ